jgi:hypothetical protein
MPPKNEFEGALKVLRRYYGDLMQQVAAEIVQNAGEFDKGIFGEADDLIEKHSCRIGRLATVYANLRGFASDEKPKGSEPLSRNEFRCFGCGHVIKEKDPSCSLCGWTWK